MKKHLRKHASDGYLVDVLNKAQREQLELLICLWLATVAAFAIWWLDPSHFTGPVRFVFNSLILVGGALIPLLRKRSELHRPNHPDPRATEESKQAYRFGLLI